MTHNFHLSAVRPTSFFLPLKLWVFRNLKLSSDNLSKNSGKISSNISAVDAFFRAFYSDVSVEFDAEWYTIFGKINWLPRLSYFLANRYIYPYHFFLKLHSRKQRALSIVHNIKQVTHEDSLFDTINYFDWMNRFASLITSIYHMSIHYLKTATVKSDLLHLIDLLIWPD